MRKIPAALMALVAACSAAAVPAPAVAAVAVQATVMERRSAWEGGLIVTRTRLRVDRVMSGTAPSTVEVTELGGRVDDIAQVAWGQPTMPARPQVAVELTPVGHTWRLTAVLEQIASGDRAGPSGPLLAGSYVRTTTKDSTPPCAEAQQEVFWPAANVHYVLDEACAPGLAIEDCEASVVASFQAWTDVECSYLSFVYDGRRADVPIGFNRTGPNVNAVKWIQDDWPGPPNALAVTLGSIGCASGRVVDADILVNGTRAAFSVAEQPAAGELDIRNTITHEAGHVAGFAHSLDPQSTMFATADPGETAKRDLTDDDAVGLCDVYPVGHEPSTDAGCACASAGDAAPSTLGLLAVVAVLFFRRRSRRRRRLSA